MLWFDYVNNNNNNKLSKQQPHVKGENAHLLESKDCQVV